MSEINFCSQCGAPLTDANANFCSQCGHKFVQPKEVVTPVVEAEHIAPKVQSTVATEENTTNQIKNTHYAKYSRILGIIGLCISAIMCIMLPIVMILIGEDEISSAHLSFNSTISQVFNSWYISFYQLIIATIPIIASFIACYFLRRFADSQTTSDKAVNIRKIALGVCITIVGWMLSLACSYTGDPFLYYYHDYYGDFGVSFFNLLGVTISLLGVLLVWINLKKLRSSNASTEGAKRFVNLASILTLVIFIILAAEFVMEFIFKCCASVDIVEYDGAIVAIILYTLMHLAIFTLVGVISLFAIISLSKNAPLLSTKEYDEVEARITESKSNKNNLTRMLCIFAGIALTCCAMYALNFIREIAFALDIFYSIDMSPMIGFFGRMGLYIPLIAIAAILLANKSTNRKIGSFLGIIFMLAGGFTMLFLNVVFGYVWYGDFATILFVNGGLALAAGYFLYIWTAECDILSKIIITIAAIIPLFNIALNNGFLCILASFNLLACAAAYIYVIIRINGLQCVKDKLRELI